MIYRYLHKCGNTLFFYDHMPEPGEVVKASHAVMPDGSNAVDGEPIRCPCGEMVGGLRRECLLELGGVPYTPKS
jgi:hypothetical protein